VPYEYVAFSRDGQEVRGVLEVGTEALAEQALWDSGYVIASLKAADSRRYEYVAVVGRDGDGQEVRGVLEAASEELAEQTLWREGYIVASLKPVDNDRHNLAGLMPFSFGVKLRDVMFIGLVLAMFLGVYFVRTQGPFVAIVGRSMEPVLHLGDFILVEKVLPQEVTEGDIIVFDVSSSLQEAHNYPPVVAHRVIEVDTSGGAPAFRTKGDNSGEDPFTVLPGDLRGRLSKSIAYLGFLPLFLQSPQGLFFVIATAVLIGLYQYSEELDRGRKGLQTVLLAPIIEEQTRHSQELQQRVGGVEQALGQLALAVREGAAQFQSHPAAVGNEYVESRLPSTASSPQYLRRRPGWLIATSARQE